MGYNIVIGGCSSAWLERLPVEQNVGGSNPLSHPKRALVAQRIEHLSSEQRVGGSIPSERASTLRK